MADTLFDENKIDSGVAGVFIEHEVFSQREQPSPTYTPAVMFKPVPRPMIAPRPGMIRPRGLTPRPAATQKAQE